MCLGCMFLCYHLVNHTNAHLTSTKGSLNNKSALLGRAPLLAVHSHPSLSWKDQPLSLIYIFDILIHKSCKMGVKKLSDLIFFFFFNVNAHSKELDISSFPIWWLWKKLFGNCIEPKEANKLQKEEYLGEALCACFVLCPLSFLSHLLLTVFSIVRGLARWSSCFTQCGGAENCLLTQIP